MGPVRCLRRIASAAIIISARVELVQWLKKPAMWLSLGEAPRGR